MDAGKRSVRNDVHSVARAQDRRRRVVRRNGLSRLEGDAKEIGGSLLSPRLPVHVGQLDGVRQIVRRNWRRGHSLSSKETFCHQCAFSKSWSTCRRVSGRSTDNAKRMMECERERIRNVFFVPKVNNGIHERCVFFESSSMSIMMKLLMLRQIKSVLRLA